jgi:hypothetical protein
MKITLGGKITIWMAVLYVGAWVLMFLFPGLLSIIAHYCLSFPLGWLSGEFSGGHQADNAWRPSFT